MGQPADIADTEIVGDKVHVNSAKGARYNYDSTAIRPRYDHSTTDVKTGLLHCGLNKPVGLNTAGHRRTSQDSQR